MTKECFTPFIPLAPVLDFSHGRKSGGERSQEYHERPRKAEAVDWARYFFFAVVSKAHGFRSQIQLAILNAEPWLQLDIGFLVLARLDQVEVWTHALNRPGSGIPPATAPRISAMP